MKLFNRMNKPLGTMFLFGLLIITSSCGGEADKSTTSAVQAKDAPTKLVDARADRKQYAPYINDTYPDNVYYGDTHVHTSYSTDAGFFGTSIGPEEAYRFAKGEVVTSSTDLKTNLLRPLDFLVVADHSENLGLAPLIHEDSPMVMNHKWGKTVYGLVKAGKFGEAYSLWGAQVEASDDPFADQPEIMANMWQRIQEAAEKHNEPGKFTAFIGFEWTSTRAVTTCIVTLSFAIVWIKLARYYPCRRMTLSTQRICGNTWKTIKLKPAARPFPLHITAISRMV